MEALRGQGVADFFHGRQMPCPIRADRSQYRLEPASGAGDWKHCTIGHRDMQAKTLAYLFGNAAHRVVAYRPPNSTGQVATSTGDAHRRMSIITNDRGMSDRG